VASANYPCCNKEIKFCLHFADLKNIQAGYEDFGPGGVKKKKNTKVLVD
jgi:hypothetical protein